MWLLLGIYIYLAIGYLFACLMEMDEEGFWEQVKVMLVWPTICIAFVVCCIVFGYIEISNRIKKKNYGSKVR